MTDAEKRAYQKGYYAGSNGRWPAHRPPAPPGELAAKVIAAARALRDGVDGELAKLGERDEWAALLGPLVDDLDAALTEVGVWVRADDRPG